MKALIKTILSFRWLAWIIGFILPIKKNRIVVCCNSGGGYSDNCKYIVSDLLKSNEKLDIIWLTASEKAKESLPKGVKNSRYNKFSSILKLLTASVWIDNSRKSFVYKKKKTLYIQTWHGGGMTKRVEKSVADKLPKNYVKIAMKDSKYINIFLSDSRKNSMLIYDAYWYDNYILENSYPRNTIIIESLTDNKIKQECLTKVNNYFGVTNKKYILYAPTFRNDENTDYYNIDFSNLINVCEEKYKDEFVVLVKLHPNIASKCDFIKYNDKILNATSYFDTQELLVAADILITDYSSINYDFSFTLRPSFRYCPDIDDYLGDRGFYFDFYKYPYPTCKTNEELFNLIKNYDENKFVDNVLEFNKFMGVLEYDKNKNVANLIIDYINEGNLTNIKEKYNLLSK